MGYYPQESLYKPYKDHGYTVRGTPNCPLKLNHSCSKDISDISQHGTSKPEIEEE